MDVTFINLTTSKDVGLTSPPAGDLKGSWGNMAFRLCLRRNSRRGNAGYHPTGLSWCHSPWRLGLRSRWCVVAGSGLEICSDRRLYRAVERWREASALTLWLTPMTRWRARLSNSLMVQVNWTVVHILLVFLALVAPQNYFSSWLCFKLYWGPSV